MADRLRILLLRGHHATSWGLKAHERLPDRFDVRLLVTGASRHDLGETALPQELARTALDRIPLGRRIVRAIGAAPDRFVGIDSRLAESDIVHAEELSLWFSADAARAKQRHKFRLVLGVYETIPLLETYRSPYARRYRRRTLPLTDLFLAHTERAANALVLEGVDPERVVVVPPGVELKDFASARDATAVRSHVLVSPGRLEWEKGHQDVIRAVAALKRGLVPAPADAVAALHLIIVGGGPERERLQAHASELGVAGAVEFREVAHRSMPALYGQASAMVLASLPRSGCSLYPGDPPRCFWEEQFGLVIAEAMAAGLPLLLSASGAIPEVAGDAGDYFAPGDWMGLARRLADRVLSRPPAERVEHPRGRLERYSTEAAAARLSAAYERAMELPRAT